MRTRHADTHIKAEPNDTAGMWFCWMLIREREASPAVLSSRTRWGHTVLGTAVLDAASRQHRVSATMRIEEQALCSDPAARREASALRGAGRRRSVLPAGLSPGSWRTLHLVDGPSLTQAWSVRPQERGPLVSACSKMQSMFRHGQDRYPVLGTGHLLSRSTWEDGRDGEEDICSPFTGPGKVWGPSQPSSLQWSSSTLAKLWKPQRATFTGDWKKHWKKKKRPFISIIQLVMEEDGSISGWLAGPSCKFPRSRKSKPIIREQF